jgi:hypothetical protein
MQSRSSGRPSHATYSAGKCGILNNAIITRNSMSVMQPHCMTLFPRLSLKVRQKMKAYKRKKPMLLSTFTVCGAIGVTLTLILLLTEMVSPNPQYVHFLTWQQLPRIDRRDSQLPRRMHNSRQQLGSNGFIEHAKSIAPSSTSS